MKARDSSCTDDGGSSGDSFSRFNALKAKITKQCYTESTGCFLQFSYTIWFIQSLITVVGSEQSKASIIEQCRGPSSSCNCNSWFILLGVLNADSYLLDYLYTNALLPNIIEIKFEIWKTEVGNYLKEKHIVSELLGPYMLMVLLIIKKLCSFRSVWVLPLSVTTTYFITYLRFYDALRT